MGRKRGERGSKRETDAKPERERNENEVEVVPQRLIRQKKLCLRF